jgi:hypothetical protein
MAKVSTDDPAELFELIERLGEGYVGCMTAANDHAAAMPCPASHSCRHHLQFSGHMVKYIAH